MSDNQTVMSMLAQRPLTREQYAATLRELEQVRAPFVKAQVDLLVCAMPRWCVHQDGTIERLDDGLTPEMHEAVSKMDAILQEAVKPFLEQLARGYDMWAESDAEVRQSLRSGGS